MPPTAAYFIVILIWSTTPLAIQWSAVGVGFAFAVMARMVIGLVVSLLILALWREPPPLHARARRSYMVGGLGLFGAMVLTYWGARFIPSGLVSVLYGLAPILTGVLARLWLDEDALTPSKWAGMALGLTGLVVIFGGSHDLGGPDAVMGLAALLVAVLIYSATMVGLKRIGDDSPPLATTAGTLAVSLPLFMAVWAVADGHAPTALNGRAGMAILYLGLFGSVIGFALYYHVIKHMETGQVALITLITPVIALLLGHWANGEVITARVWAGVACVGLGLVMHQWGVFGARLARDRPS
jgi:drug/metabolite transporter (DMT)-like permease